MPRRRRTGNCYASVFGVLLLLQSETERRTHDSRTKGSQAVNLLRSLSLFLSLARACAWVGGLVMPC